MKKLLLVAAATLVCVGAFAQGKLSFDINSNNLIYITTDTTKMLAADVTKTADNQFGAGLVALPGSSLYSGVNSTAAALGGTWVVSLYGGVSSSSLSLQTTTTLADVSSGNCGGIVAVNLTFASLVDNSPAWFEIKVGNGAAYAGQSMLFEATPQTAVFSPIYQTQAPVSATLAPGTQELTDYVANFGAGSGFLGGIAVSVVPEPGTFALAGLGLAALLVFRRRS